MTVFLPYIAFCLRFFAQSNLVDKFLLQKGNSFQRLRDEIKKPFVDGNELRTHAKENYNEKGF
jgi:hypothetical protein